MELYFLYLGMLTFTYFIDEYYLIINEKRVNWKESGKKESFNH